MKQWFQTGDSRSILHKWKGVSDRERQRQTERSRGCEDRKRQKSGKTVLKRGRRREMKRELKTKDKRQSESGRVV